MKLEKYIAQLLYRHQCVTISDFGSFLTEIRSAYLQRHTNTFYPPQKVISFNALLKKNDGLLPYHISRVEQISYDEALLFVQQEISLWKKILDRGEVLSLKNIGEIKLNFENNLVFTASENTNYLTDSFGLSSVFAPIIRRNYGQKNTTETPQPKAVFKESKDKQDVIYLPRKNKKYSFIKYAVASIIVFNLGFFTTNYYYGNYIEHESYAVEKSVQEEIENRIQQATFVIQNPNSEPIKFFVKEIKEEKHKFHIVAGAFREEENAKKLFKVLKEQGYESRKLNQNRYGLYPVLYGSYPTREEAVQNLRKIQRENYQVWLLVEEL